MERFDIMKEDENEAFFKRFNLWQVITLILSTLIAFITFDYDRSGIFIYLNCGIIGLMLGFI